MELLGPLSAWGYRFRGPEFYQGHEWLSFDFPEHPAKLYVACCDRETYQELQEIRLVDTGGIDYWQGGLHYWHSKLLLLTASKALELGFSSRGRSRRGLGELFDYAQVEIKEAKQLHEDVFQPVFLFKLNE